VIVLPITSFSQRFRMNLIVLAATGGSRKFIGVHEATAPEAAPTRQLDEGVATAFVGATSNNAHKLILFSQKTNGVAGSARIKGNSVVA
jgi:hypothetical protein